MLPWTPTHVRTLSSLFSPRPSFLIQASISCRVAFDILKMVPLCGLEVLNKPIMVNYPFNVCSFYFKASHLTSPEGFDSFVTFVSLHTELLCFCFGLHICKRSGSLIAIILFLCLFKKQTSSLETIIQMLKTEESLCLTPKDSPLKATENDGIQLIHWCSRNSRTMKSKALILSQHHFWNLRDDTDLFCLFLACCQCCTNDLMGRKVISVSFVLFGIIKTITSMNVCCGAPNQLPGVVVVRL